jgi:hypothetical protein
MCNFSHFKLFNSAFNAVFLFITTIFRKYKVNFLKHVALFARIPSQKLIINRFYMRLLKLNTWSSGDFKFLPT